MKKTVALLLLLCLLAGLMTGCGAGSDASKTKKINVVTTIFPMYDWLREIAGDQAASG